MTEFANVNAHGTGGQGFNLNHADKLSFRVGGVKTSDTSEVTVSTSRDGVTVGIEHRDEPGSPFVDGAWTTLTYEQAEALRDVLTRSLPVTESEK